MGMIKWVKPSGLKIETNDMDETVEYCKSLDWKRANGRKPKDNKPDNDKPPEDKGGSSDPSASAAVTTEK